MFFFLSQDSVHLVWFASTRRILLAKNWKWAFWLYEKRKRLLPSSTYLKKVAQCLILKKDRLRYWEFCSESYWICEVKIIWPINIQWSHRMRLQLSFVPLAIMSNSYICSSKGFLLPFSFLFLLFLWSYSGIRRGLKVGSVYGSMDQYARKESVSLFKSKGELNSLSLLFPTLFNFPRTNPFS